ncbi:hypothetical protein J8Z24_18255 [Pseudoalteromonas sp. SCSIO 43201]|uniref:hypothetical protein n=1 Tax=Pseudoalteromonas sp. SCSIO 43201 TaxID=2822842 RepID=UPI0020766299|nr:hypothetical protein [Pseudoalteromonas sp. SCSIO 43201]USD30904.1 hypothetical protein J8Z24_18255 [Pseudoalteromonas sp. SCSIO 43201]
MGNYRFDQITFKNALKTILGAKYNAAAAEANAEKARVLAEVGGEPSLRDKNRAAAAGNRVMAEWAKNAGVLSVSDWIKSQR